MTADIDALRIEQLARPSKTTMPSGCYHVAWEHSHILGTQPYAGFVPLVVRLTCKDCGMKVEYARTDLVGEDNR